MRRRTLLTRAGVASTVWLSGCSIRTSDGSVDLLVQNGYRKPLVAAISIYRPKSLLQRTRELVYERTVALDPISQELADTEIRRNILDGGTYDVEVNVENGVTRSHRFTMGDCSTQEFQVEFESREDIEFGRNLC